MSEYRITMVNASYISIRARSPVAALELFRREYHGVPIVEVARVVRGRAAPVYRLDGDTAVKIQEGKQ